MGIGLSLVAKLIDLWGGKIWIEDRIDGDYSKGTNFVFLIPKVSESRNL
jgi:signal transduction histidine kinase